MKMKSLILVCVIAVAQAAPGTYLVETADDKGVEVKDQEPNENLRFNKFLEKKFT